MGLNDFQKELTKEACFLRGQSITGYSMVEFVLADISVRLDLKFPYPIKDRIKAAKKIVNRSEYGAYRNDFHRVCDKLLRYDELRNFMAHGERYGTGKYRRRTLEFSVEDFRRVADEMVRYTNDAYAVFHKFYIEQAVETFVHPNA
jgi:hypothetical protein